MKIVESGQCPDGLCELGFFYSPFLLLGLPPLFIAHYILTTFFRMEKWIAFELTCKIYYLIVLPIIFVASLWYAYIYIPKKWHDEHPINQNGRGL